MKEDFVFLVFVVTLAVAALGIAVAFSWSSVEHAKIEAQIAEKISKCEIYETDKWYDGRIQITLLCTQDADLAVGQAEDNGR